MPWESWAIASSIFRSGGKSSCADRHCSCNLVPSITGWLKGQLARSVHSHTLSCRWKLVLLCTNYLCRASYVRHQRWALDLGKGLDWQVASLILTLMIMRQDNDRHRQRLGLQQNTSRISQSFFSRKGLRYILMFSLPPLSFPPSGILMHCHLVLWQIKVQKPHRINITWTFSRPPLSFSENLHTGNVQGLGGNICSASLRVCRVSETSKHEEQKWN